MIQVIETICPIVLTILLGWGLVRRGFLGDAFLADLNQFIFWVGLPALIVRALATTEGLPTGTLPVFCAFLIASLLVTALAFLWVSLSGMSRQQVGAFVQGSFRGNLAFIAIPIMQFALRHEEANVVNDTLALAFFVFAPTMVYYNVVSVVLLVKCQAVEGGNDITRSIRSIASNPLILSSALGVIIYLLPLELPTVMADTLGYIGRMAGPASLICVGGGMAKAGWKGQISLAGWSAALKVFALPLIAWGVALPFGLSPHALFVLLILSASPAAVAGYVLVKAMEGDEALASSNIVVSTLLSVLSLSAVIWWFTP